jgi:hypothetical protein
MKTMQATPFTRNLLLMLVGPLIWAAHFLAIYVFNGILCARPHWNIQWAGMSLSSWGILGAAVIAVLAITAILLRAHPSETAADNRAFIRWMSLALSLLSMVAIVWETVPVLLLPACG